MRAPEGGSFSDAADSPKLFSLIARRYDAMNRLMSLGRDKSWRRAAAAALAPPRQGRVLDVGVGTGDMALALNQHWPDVSVTGIDPTRAMLNHGRQKPGMPGVGLAQASGLSLPFPDQSFDAAVSAFVLRNVVDVDAALAEQRRVVRHGGRVACLEMSWPRTPVFGALFHFYFSELMPRVTGWLTRHPVAYQYLPRSVERFQTPKQLKATMERVGLSEVRYRPMALGTVMLHVGVRAARDKERVP